MISTTSYGGYADYEAAGHTLAMLAGASGAVAAALPHLREIVPRFVYSGSGGIVSPDTDHDPCLFHIGSSPCVVAFRPIEPAAEAGVPDHPLGFRNVLELSVVEQMQELQAALSLNRSQLARILRVSRPALYDWLRGREPNAANTERVHTLLRCLARTRVSGANLLNARFVRQSADLDGPALIDLLAEERIDEDRLVNAIEQARALGDTASRRRANREERLRDLGFEDPGPEQRREQLARNMALRDWPNR